MYQQNTYLPHRTNLTRIFYLHIPKCGSSFATLLVQYACPSLPKNLTVAEPSYFQYPVGIKLNFTEYCSNAFSRFESGHAPLPDRIALFQAGKEFWEENNIVTFLRHPNERIPSGFLHNFHDCMVDELALKYAWLFPREQVLAQDASSPDYARLFHESNRENLTDIFTYYWRCVEGCASRMVLGYPCGNNFSRPKVTFTPSLFRSVAWRLDRFAFIGLTERWEESTFLWRSVYGGNYSELILENTRPSERSEYKSILRELVNDLGLVDEADSRLYVSAEARFLQDLIFFTGNENKIQ